MLTLKYGPVPVQFEGLLNGHSVAILKEVTFMNTEKEKIKEKETDKELKKTESTECRYIVDECGCFVDPCGCRVSACCCC